MLRTMAVSGLAAETLALDSPEAAALLRSESENGEWSAAVQTDGGGE